MEISFTNKVYEYAKQIPKGKVATYKQLAILAGNPKAARAVGMAMKHNPDMSIIPCHRVVGSDGKMHGYSARKGIKSKIEILREEGVEVTDGRINLSKYKWNRK